MAEKRHIWYWLGVLVRCALLGGLLFQAGMFLLRLCLDVTFPYPLDYGEGIALDRAVALARGEPLYLPMDRSPYASWNFPPLYAWLCGLGARWIGPGFAFGRAVSAVAVLATAVCVYLLARRHVEAESPVAWRGWAAVAALLFLTSETTATWGALMRVDSLAIALGLAGYTAIVTGLSPVLAGALFGMALLCKQSVVAGLLAAVLALAAARRWKDLATMAAVTALLVGTVLAWQHVASEGWLWRHLIACNANAWRFDQLREVAGPVAVSHRVLFALAALGAVWSMARRAPGRPGVLRSPGLYYLATAAVVALLAGKIGSHVNYLLDLAAAAAIVGVGFAARLERALNRRFAAGVGAAAASALLYAQVWGSFSYPSVEQRTPMGAATAAVVRTLARAPGPVVTEDPALAPLAGKPLSLQAFEFAQMAEAGRWDQGPLLAALRRGEFSAILLRFDPWRDSHRDAEGTWAHGRFTDEMVAAMRASYRVSERYYCWVILRPR